MEPVWRAGGKRWTWELYHDEPINGKPTVRLVCNRFGYDLIGYRNSAGVIEWMNRETHQIGVRMKWIGSTIPQYVTKAAMNILRGNVPNVPPKYSRTKVPFRTFPATRVFKPGDKIIVNETEFLVEGSAKPHVFVRIDEVKISDRVFITGIVALAEDVKESSN